MKLSDYDTMELFDKPETTEKARDLIMRAIDYDTFVYYNNLWHSRMPLVGGFYIDGFFFCLEFNSICYGVAAWSQPIAANRLHDGFDALELRRMALPDYAPRNSASRFISLMTKEIKKHNKYKYLLSYQDTGSHLGTIYKASNWIAVNKAQITSWTTENRVRAKDQSESPKIRWEYKLK